MIKLSDHFTYEKLIKFTTPSISMLIFLSIYGVVDGFFVSNFVGKIEFTALNFIMPFLMILGFVGFLFGTGGGALIAISIFLGILFSIFGIIFIGDVAKFLGANGELL